jgi:HPt (histidine-containing phosphotransfer) domain-containing protein
MTDPAIDPVGLERLLEMAGGDQEFMAELIDTYLEDGERQLDEMASAVADGDATAAVRPAHSLRTGSANVGATLLASLCGEVETAARDGALGNGESRVAAAREAFAAARTELLAYRGGT